MSGIRNVTGAGWRANTVLAPTLARQAPSGVAAAAAGRTLSDVTCPSRPVWNRSEISPPTAASLPASLKQRRMSGSRRASVDENV